MTLNHLNKKSDNSISRRKFFKVVSGIFTGAIALSLGIPMIESIVGTIAKKKSRTFSQIAPVNSIPEDKPVDLPFVMTEIDAYLKTNQPETVWAVKHKDQDITVFSPICPHLGCRYQWHPDRELFICPCHHSIFNMNGKVISGPAPRPLDTLPKEIKHNYLYVLWERFKPGIPKKEIIGY